MKHVLSVFIVGDFLEGWFSLCNPNFSLNELTWCKVEAISRGGKGGCWKVRGVWLVGPCIFTTTSYTLCKHTQVAWKHRKYFRLQFIDRHRKGREARLRVLDIYWTERNMMFFATVYPYMTLIKFYQFLWMRTCKQLFGSLSKFQDLSF